MREVKFRAYTDGKMFHDVGVVRNIVVLECEYSEEYGDVDLEPTYYGLNDDSIKLMQFTGLHDKNGKEIYEGDIVQSVLGEQTFTDQVVYKDAEFCAQSISDEEWLDELLSDCKELEVIGNIYEHNHLLEGEVNGNRN